MIMIPQRPFTITLSLLLLTAALGCAPAAASREPAAAGALPQRPAERAEAEAEAAALPYDIATLDLKQVFETLGEDAIIWYQHVQTLANPYFEGRVDASAGMERARDYLEFYFRTYGLAPAFPGADGGPGSYRQPFTFKTSPRIEVTVTNARARIGSSDLAENEQFVILGNSESGDVTGPVTFVGYGIDSDRFSYSSFEEDTDLTGRIALLLRYEPLELDGTSQWFEDRGGIGDRRSGPFSREARLPRKMRNVERRGAAGIILVNPPGVQGGREGLGPRDESRPSSGARSLGIPVIEVTPEVADDLLRKADPAGRDLMTWRRLADMGEVTSVDLDDSLHVSIAAAVERKREDPTIDAANIAAALPGKGDLADEWLVIGGHYDHNGYGWFGTTPEAGELFPGADDNASGTAGILVLARKLVEEYEQTVGDLRSVLFIAFDAEERGLHGSRYFSDHPTVEPEKITALLNMDMIGRLRDDRLSVLGVGTGEGLLEILQSHFDSSGLHINAVETGSGRSDDANFHRINVPAVHFYTDMHPEYTSPADKAYTVNPIGAAKILELVYDIAFDLATRPDRLMYADAGGTPSRDRGYAPVRLGIRPGMGEQADGILVDSVSPGASAAEAGMQGGDVIVAWNDEPMTDLRRLFQQLQEHQAGDEVKVTVIRDGEQKDLVVKLQASEEERE